MKNTFTQLVQSAARRLGYEVLPTWRLDQWQQTELLKQILQHYRIDCILDVGANKGQFVDYLRQHVEYQGEVISFEPIARNAAILSARAATDPRWRVCQFALGRDDAETTLNVMATDVFSSFLKPTIDGTPAFKSMNAVSSVELVQIRRLDDVLVELGIVPASRSIFLKLDTQGFDLEVVAGAEKTLNQFKVIQSEVSCIPIYENMPDMHDAIRAFSHRGYSIAGMFPVTRQSNLSVVEFDAVFVNNGISSS